MITAASTSPTPAATSPPSAPGNIGTNVSVIGQRDTSWLEISLSRLDANVTLLRGLLEGSPRRHGGTVNQGDEKEE
jgi:hypothetical protein